MRSVIFISIFVLGLASAGCLTRNADGQRLAADPLDATAARVPVIVELFTSEGCSSCPPADRALKFLAEQQPVTTAEVIPLAFHVDYWNNLGWQDKFSSAAFSRRQELYVARFGIDGSYTPEMVVDGRAEFVGSDTGRAAKVIADAVKDRKGTATLSVDGDTISVSVADLPQHDPATVFLAITEDNITSDVRAGENNGQTFNHTSVVRSLSTLGLIEKDANKFEAKSSLPVVAGLKRENSRLVVFVQDNVDRKIIAVGTAKQN
jgi:hypothetical protein